MCNRSTTIDEIVKDRISIRLIETKWVDEVKNLIYLALQKRNERGQDLTTVKFEELYNVSPMEMENKLHEKINDFLSSNIDGSDNHYTMNLSESNSPCAVNVDINDTPSDDVSTNENTKVR
ncbi:unnamed protein product [Macrosiphum euphorbiae]|uniref:Uncharacterized protein n=1 Tax=Macrosiphum euphorbiae TaxID=13131 RepID=A0AAV0X6Z9_9HEMI|nr:unnamed protein product [Macrosiphum euphorbiae]